MFSILLLALMVVMIVTMRPVGGAGSAGRTSGASRSNIAGRPRASHPDKPNKKPGVVTYALMEDKKLPSPAQRLMRRIARPFLAVKLWASQRFFKSTGDTSGPGLDRAARPSAELQNFLDARNREIARRKAEGPSRPGPEDRLH